MATKVPGYYLTMRHSVSADAGWETEAGPFTSADEAIDATMNERTHSGDYDDCALWHVDERGTVSQVEHPRLAFNQHSAEGEQWWFGEKDEASEDNLT